MDWKLELENVAIMKTSATLVTLLLILASPFFSAAAAETADNQRATAQQLLKAAEDEHGKSSPELVRALINLAAAELKLSDWNSAMISTSRALDILHDSDDLNVQIFVLSLRSRAYGGSGDYKSATRDVDAALRLNRKTEHTNRHQEALLYQRLLEISARQRNLQDANRYASKMLKAARKHFGKDSEKYIPTLLLGADWYRSSGQLDRERKILWQCIEIMETVYGPNDGRLAHPLRRIAQSYIFSHKSADTAKNVLRRTIDLEFSTPGEAAANQAGAKAELADYIVVFEDPQTATALYEEAWKIMAEDSGIGAAVANQTFDSVKILYYQRPSKPATGRGTEVFVEGFMEVEFTVTALGTVDTVDIVDFQPPEMKGVRFIQAYERARYRPRVVDGKTAATPNVSHRSTYSRNDYKACRSKVPTEECLTL